MSQPTVSTTQPPATSQPPVLPTTTQQPQIMATTTQPPTPPSSTSGLVLAGTSGSPSAPSAQSPVRPMTSEQLTMAVLDLGQAVASIRSFLAGSYAPQPPQFPHPPPPSLPYSQPPVSNAYAYGMPYDGLSSYYSPVSALASQGVPITQLRFPASPSPLPAWLLDSSAPLVYTSATTVHEPLPASTSSVMHGGVPASGTLCGSVDGSLFHGGMLLPASAPAGGAPYAAAPAPGASFAAAPSAAGTAT